MYISLLEFPGADISDAERDGLKFATEDDGCLWTRHATQIPMDHEQPEDAPMEYWISRWESVEHHQKFLQSNGPPEIVEKLNERTEFLSVFHSIVGPDDAISAVLSAAIIELVIVKLNTKYDSEGTREEMEDALARVQWAASGCENVCGSLTGVLVEHKSLEHDYMNGKPGGIILFGLTTSEEVYLPSLYSRLRSLGNLEVKHIVFKNRYHGGP